MMRHIGKQKRTIELTNEDIGDLQRIDKDLKDQLSYSTFPPLEAIVLDEDMCSLTLVSILRRMNISYKNNSQKNLSLKGNVEVISSAHIFDTTEDKALLKWCNRHSYPLVTCNYQDFIDLHKDHQHSGIICNTAGTEKGFDNDQMAKIINKILSNNSKIEVLNEIFQISISS